jgi:putative CocE/NonD family hydrolase
MPKSQYYVMGSNRWESDGSLPGQRAALTAYYFHSAGAANSRFGDGSLSLAKPKAEKPDQFVSDPGYPVPSHGGPICCTGQRNDDGAVDQREIEARQDVLVYSTAPLESPVTVVGPIKAVLHISSSARDADFVVKLVDVLPDGTAFNLAEGIQRARYRDGFSQPALLEPNGVYRLEVDLQATGISFLAGHRIRVEVAGSSYPRFARNFQTGGDGVTETAWVTATNTIHHSAKYPSHVALPVVPRGG